MCHKVVSFDLRTALTNVLITISTKKNLKKIIIIILISFAVKTQAYWIHKLPNLFYIFISVNNDFFSSGSRINFAQKFSGKFGIVNLIAVYKQNNLFNNAWQITYSGVKLLTKYVWGSLVLLHDFFFYDECHIFLTVAKFQYIYVWAIQNIFFCLPHSFEKCFCTSRNCCLFFRQFLYK